MTINKTDSIELCNGVLIVGDPCTGKTTLINKLKAHYDIERLGISTLFLDDCDHYTNAAIKIILSNNDFVVMTGNHTAYGSTGYYGRNENFFYDNNLLIFSDLDKAEGFIKDKFNYLISLVQKDMLNKKIKSKNSKSKIKRI